MTQRKQPLTVRKGIEGKLASSIYVTMDYDPQAPEIVHVTWDNQDTNHMNWRCFHYFTDYLIENEVWFTVSRFQVNEAEVFVHSEEARAMLKLMFQAGNYEIYTDDMKRKKMRMLLKTRKKFY